MRARDFVYWLQGYFEIGNPTNINSAELSMIRAHLNLVFKHEIDPAMGDANHQAELNAIHDSASKPTLAELLPNHSVIYSDSPVDFQNKPEDWQPDWQFDTFHQAWHPPNEKLRC